jgi:hypothetical protein
MKRLRRSTALSLLAPLLVLVAMGYASPPDPSWIAGVYDAVDLDDVIVFVISSPAAAGSLVVHDVRPSCIVVAAPVHASEGAVSVGVPSHESVRAPPPAG